MQQPLIASLSTFTCKRSDRGRETERERELHVLSAYKKRYYFNCAIPCNDRRLLEKANGRNN